jgi:hypothetical protein
MAIDCVTGNQFPVAAELFLFTTVYKLPIFLEYRAFFPQWEGNQGMKLTAHPSTFKVENILVGFFLLTLSHTSRGIHWDTRNTDSFPAPSCSTI